MISPGISPRIALDVALGIPSGMPARIATDIFFVTSQGIFSLIVSRVPLGISSSRVSSGACLGNTVGMLIVIPAEVTFLNFAEVFKKFFYKFLMQFPQDSLLG